MTRMIDPGARARSFAARRGGMLDTQKLRGQIQTIHARTAPVSGEVLEPESWFSFEEVNEPPSVDEDIVGRGFLQRNDGADDVLSVGITAADGTPILIGLSTLGLESDVPFLWTNRVNSGLTGVSGVSLDSLGNVYVSFGASGGIGTLRKYTPALTSAWSVVIPADPSSQNATNGTTLFHTVSDGIFKRVAATGADGVPQVFGTAGTGNGQYNGAIGVAYDGTSEWVVDVVNNRVQKSSAAGVYASQFDGSSSGLAFNGPTGITIGPTATHLYVLDAGNGRIVKFLKSDHSFVEAFTFGVGNGEGQIGASAEGIAVTSDGRIWIADTPNHRINLYDATGVFIASFGSFGSGDEQFKFPRQIAAGALSRIWIADSGNNRLVTIEESSSDLNLGFDAYDWDEEFVGGGTTSGAIGERGWTSAVSAGATVSVQASTSASPGLLRLATGATSGNSLRITLGPWILSQIDKMLFIFAPASNANISSARVGAGIGGGTNPLNSATPSEGAAVEFDTATSTGFMVVAKYVGGVATKTVTAVPFVAGALYLAEFTRTGSSEITVRVRRLATGDEEIVVLTGISTSAQLDATFFGRTSAAVTKSIDPDYWSGSFSGLNRV